MGKAKTYDDQQGRTPLDMPGATPQTSYERLTPTIKPAAITPDAHAKPEPAVEVAHVPADSGYGTVQPGQPQEPPKQEENTRLGTLPAAPPPPRRLKELEDTIRDAKRELRDLMQQRNQDITETKASEIKKLVRWSTFDVFFLSGVIVACVFGVAWVLLQRPDNTTTNWPGKYDWPVIVLCIVGGTIGSSLAALRSVLDRMAAGWEFSDGTTYPDEEKKERFNLRMRFYFMFRPLFGTALGYLIYLVLLGGLPEVSNPFSQIPPGLQPAFWSFLAGLFAKTLLDWLLDVFKAAFGK
jgi:hypothetical protein